MYLNELKRRKEIEKSLKEANEEMEKMRSEAETRIAESNMVIRNLQAKYSLSMKVLRRLRDEQEELKREISEVSKLKSKREEEEASPSKDLEPPQYFICPITQVKETLERLPKKYKHWKDYQKNINIGMIKML